MPIPAFHRRAVSSLGRAGHLEATHLEATHRVTLGLETIRRVTHQQAFSQAHQISAAYLQVLEPLVFCLVATQTPIRLVFPEEATKRAVQLEACRAQATSKKIVIIMEGITILTIRGVAMVVMSTVEGECKEDSTAEVTQAVQTPRGDTITVQQRKRKAEMSPPLDLTLVGVKNTGEELLQW